ncbi:MAG: hypothetical protein KDA96_06650 [Planctomycetaceae bacterium]|nr:hypothetical protein [Planctomycetaceae bacterium]
MTGLLPPCDVIVDSAPRSGQQNMDLDAMLLQHGLTSNRSIVRIYRWSEPTVTVGYFQRGEPAAEPLDQLPTVTRLTGGGAILHHNEWTYSCVLPDCHPVRDNPTELYRIVHRALVRLFHECGAATFLRSESPDFKTASEGVAEPFLCFLRQDPNDIVCGIHKVVGSAQRRRRGTILQHGSLLMQHSVLVPGVPGLCDLAPDFDSERFARLLPPTIANAIATEIRYRDFTAQEIVAANALSRS